MQAIEEKVHFEHKVYLRLSQVFDSLDKPRQFPQFPAKNPLYTQINGADEKLCFIFNNEIDSDPQFSGEVIGELYLKKDVLFLNIISKKDHKRIEIEHPGISHVKWEFFDLETKTWASDWPKEKSFPPLILKLTFRGKAAENDRPYCFFLGDPKVIYLMEEALP